MASKKARPDVAKGWAVRAPRLYVVSHEELFRRLEGVRDVDRLEQKRVVCFGLGAIGSPLAFALAREGVGSFVLCDPDTLRPGNIIRHALDLLSVGQFKAEAVEAALSRINPSVETRCRRRRTSPHPDVIAAKLSGADLVVAAIGNDLNEELLSEVVLSSEERPPMLLVRIAARRCRVPGRSDASRRRRMLDLSSRLPAERHPDWIDVPADGLPDVFDAGCAAPARPALGWRAARGIVRRRARSRRARGPRSPKRITGCGWSDRSPAAISAGRGTSRSTPAKFLPRPDCPICGV